MAAIPSGGQPPRSTRRGQSRSAGQGLQLQAPDAEHVLDSGAPHRRSSGKRGPVLHPERWR
eukprot:13047114-Alexandrium_andersonii.AAC.1